MGLKLAGARLLLKGGLLNGTRYVSVKSAEATEFTDAWYNRKSIALADWTRNNMGLAENTAALDFDTPTANAVASPSHIGLSSHLDPSNAADVEYLTSALTGSPAAPALGASFGFDAGTLELTDTANDAVTALGMKKAYESGLVSGTTYMAVLAGDPTGAGVQLLTRQSITAANWLEDSGQMNSVRNNVALNYGVTASALSRPTYVGLYDALTSGNLLWYDALDSQALVPAAGATISIAVNAIRIGFTIDA